MRVRSDDSTRGAWLAYDTEGAAGDRGDELPLGGIEGGGHGARPVVCRLDRGVGWEGGTQTRGARGVA